MLFNIKNIYVKISFLSEFSEILANMKLIRKNTILILEAIDICSYPFCFLFTFKGKFRYSTFSTKIMTLLILSFSLASLFYFGRNVLAKTNPQCILNEEYNVDADAIYMDANSFFFTFGIENTTNNYIPFIDESIYKVEAYLLTRNNETQSWFPVNLTRCDESHIPNNNQAVKNYFIRNHYQDLYCFQNYSEVFMNGTWDSEVSTEIQIAFRQCDNYTDNNTCQSQEIISNMLEGGYMVMHYTSFQTALNNYDSPLNISPVDDFQATSLQMSTDINIYFSQVKVQTDIGIFTEDFISHQGINWDSNQYNFYQKNNGTFMNLYLRLDANVKTTTRTYDNILDVLSKVGGLMRILSVFGFVVLKSFIRDAMLQRISNEAFDYDEYLNEIKGKKPQNNMKKSEKITLSCWGYVKSKFEKHSQLSLKSRIIIQSLEIMKKNLDISNLINRLFEIEKLKLTSKKEEFEFLNSHKPKIIWDEQKFEGTHFKSELEKVFQRKFCLHQETQNFRKEISDGKKQLTPNEIQKVNLPITVNIKNIINGKNYEEKKKEEIRKDEALIQLPQNLGKKLYEKSENEKFNDFERELSKIGDENHEKEVIDFIIPVLFTRKKSEI